MGYYASWGGFISINREKAKNAGLYKAAIKEMLEYAFDAANVEYDDASKLSFDVYGDTKYYEDTVIDILNKIAPYTIDGKIEYSGEDECRWRFIFNGKKFVEENGMVVYETSFYSVTIKTIVDFNSIDISTIITPGLDIAKRYFDATVKMLQKERKNETPMVAGRDDSIIEQVCFKDAAVILKACELLGNGSIKNSNNIRIKNF